MTIKEIAERKGISLTAVYKRIKGAGINLSKLKQKGTGELTAEGERVLLDLFGLDEEAESQEPAENTQVESPVESEVEKVEPRVENQGERLNLEVERLKIKVESLEKQVKSLTDERDYLRQALERAQQALEHSQQLQAMTTAKLPAPVPVEERRGLFGWGRKKKKKQEGGSVE